MSSLATCLRKAKVLTEEDASAIRAAYQDLVDTGLKGSEAADRAISEYMAVLDDERSGVRKEAEAQGVAPESASEKLLYSTDSKSDTPLKLSIIAELYGENKGKMLPGMTKKSTIKDLAKILTARAKKTNRGKSYAAKTARNKEIVSEAMVLEALEAMKQTGHAGTWYSQVLRDALAIAGTLHPEINTDSEARTAFIFGMAITSNGMAVSENTKYAEKVYASYKRNGKFPNFGTGAEAGAMKKAFKLFNDLKEKWGMKSLTEFLNTDFTVAELKILGLSVSGENTTTTVKGSAIFGPKVGGGFYQNLSGNFDPLTMDRWWMRTWGRLVGNLSPEGISAAQNQVDNFLATLDGASDVVESYGYTVDEIQQSDKKMMALATKLHNKYAQGSFKDKSDINKAAKLLDTAVNFPIVAPRNGTERQWIREVVAETQRKLTERGYETDTASLQALLWYPEKEFYLQNGVGNERSKPTDYAQELAKLAKSRGITQSGIDGAIATARERLSAGNVGATTAASIEAGRGPTLAAKERQLLLQDAALRFLRELPATYSSTAPKGAARELNGAPVRAIHKPVIKAKNKLQAAGLAAPSFVELEPSPESAKLFFKRAQKGSGPTQNGYESMRLFMTPDGKAGFAIDGDQILSLYKNSDVKESGLAYPSLLLAVQEGARTLVTKDDFTQYAYAKIGFTTAARTSGSPDTLYMVHEESVHAHEPGEGLMVENEAEAVAAQEMLRDSAEPGRKRNRYRLDDDADTSEPGRILNRIESLKEQGKENKLSVGYIVSETKKLLRGKNGARQEAALSLIPRRNLKDFVRGNAMPSVAEYINLASRMDGRAFELQEQADELGKRWMRYTSKNKAAGKVLGSMMHNSTLAEVDPSKPYKPLKTGKMNLEDRAKDNKRREAHAYLKGFWDKMDTEAQSIYREVRDSYQENRRLVEKSITERIEQSEADPDAKRSVLTELRKQFEAGRVSGPYFPLARFGKLWASAKDADGEVVAFSKFEDEVERKAWEKEMRAGGFKVEHGKDLNSESSVKHIDPGFASKVTQLAGNVDKQLADEIWQLYLSNMPEMSMRKAFIHRKGRLGFATNALRAYGNAMFHGSHQISKLEYGGQMEAKLQEMEKEVQAMEAAGASDELWGAAVYIEMQKRHEAAMNPSGSAWAATATSLGFAWYLGATPAAALVNLSQSAIVGLPVLGARFSFAGASVELGKGSALFAASHGKMEDRLRGDERAAMDEARKMGIFSKTQGHDLAGMSEEGGSDVSSKQRQAMEIAGWMFHNAERANREVAFLAGYRLGRKEGLSHEDAIQVSEDLVWDAHFDYNTTNRPRVMQGDWPRVLFLFRQYSMNMTYRLARDFRDGVLQFTSGASKAEKTQALQRFAGMMTMTSVFAGATGLPMVWAVTGLLDALFGDEDEPFDSEAALRVWLAEQYGSKMAEAIVKGPTDAYVGVTASSRVGLNNLWIQEVPENLEGRQLAQHLVFQLAGPVIGGMGEAAVNAWELATGNQDDEATGRAVEGFMPKFVKDALKTARYAEEGVQNRRGDVILSKEDLTWRDLVAQGIGFTPAPVTLQYDQNRATGNVAKKIVKRRSSLMDRLFLAYRQGDAQERKATMAAIAKFNKANPGLSISPDSILSSAKSRAAYSARSVNGLALSPKQSHLHRKYKFTPEKGEK